MRVRRKRYQKGSRFYSVFQVQLDEDEMTAFIRSNLGSFKIQRHAGSIVGSSLTSVGIANALQAQVNRLRNRWSVALSRTTGSILLDLIILYLRLIRDLLVFLLKVIFGTRQTFSGLIAGTKYSAKRIEEIKEIETFVLVSIAAAHQALVYAMDIERDDTFVDHDYRSEIAGLTFAGAIATAEATQGIDTNSAISDFSQDSDMEEVEEVEDFAVDVPDMP